MKIGIDLGGSHVAVGLVEGEKIISKRERDFIEEDRYNIEQSIEKTVGKYIKEILEENNLSVQEIEKIGIAAPGTCKNGVILKAENLGIYNFNIVESIKKIVGRMDISLDNDANCAAMCEKQFGSLKDSEDAIFLCLGTGIGGAVFLKGKLLKAQKFTGFELGHITIEKNGNKCACGKLGCFETYCSMRILKEKIRKRVGEEEISPDEIQSILKHECENIADIVDEFIDNLSIGIANFIDIFEPEKIAIGGSFVYYKDILLPKLVDRLHKGKTTFNDSLPEFVVAKFGNNAGIIGATLM